MEILYYFKNINSLTLESTNFSLNDEEFEEIKKISNNVDHAVLIVFWQFTIKTLNELDIVSNQHLSIEMFLIRLIHLVSSSSKTDSKNTTLESFQKDKDQKVSFTQIPNCCGG